MSRPILQALAVVCLVTGLEAVAQPECVTRHRPWEPKRDSVLFIKDSDQPPAKLLVAGGVATTLVFPAAVNPSGTRVDAPEGRFNPLAASENTVVIIPAHDLAAGENFSLRVLLKDGTSVPFTLVAPGAHQSSHGQVDVRLHQENFAEVQRALQVAHLKVQRLSQELEQRAENEASLDGALAALLARGRDDLSPFVAFNSIRLTDDDGVVLKIVSYKRRNSKTDMGKSAVLFEVTNHDKRPWALDEVRLVSDPYPKPHPFAMRASAPVIAPGGTGRIAVVIPTDNLKTGIDGARFVLELWRTGIGPSPTRQAKVELVSVDEGLLPTGKRGAGVQ